MQMSPMRYVTVYRGNTPTTTTYTCNIEYYLHKISSTRMHIHTQCSLYRDRATE